MSGGPHCMSGLGYDPTLSTLSHAVRSVRDDCCTRYFIAIEFESLATFFQWSEDHNRNGNAEHYWQH